MMGLLNLRNALMAGKRTPQPVEYLESDGNQWFDVTADYTSNTGFFIDYTLIGSPIQKGIFGSGTVNSLKTRDFKLIVVGDGRQRFDRCDRSSSRFSAYGNQRQNFTFNPKGSTSSLPYRYYSSLAGSIRQDDTWYSSTYSVNGPLGVFHVYNRADLPALAMRLYGLELREYSSATAYTTTLKLSPVSVGGVGAMLDEITGETYFNMGSGDFVLGPDKN